MAQAKKALSKGAKKNSRAAQTRAAVKSYPNYIGGEWVSSASGEWFENTNPADTRDVVGRFPASDASDVERAVSAARDAADKWRRLPAPRRAEILFRLGEILIRNKDRFAREMTREMGKVLKETGGDVQEAIDCTYYTAGEGRRHQARRRHSALDLQSGQSVRGSGHSARRRQPGHGLRGACGRSHYESSRL